MVFLSKASAEAGVPKQLSLSKRVGLVSNTRSIRKQELVHNAYRPKIEVDPQAYVVRADGVVLTCEPARGLPLAQRYFLF